MLPIDQSELYRSRRTKVVYNRIFNRRPFVCTGDEYHYENSSSGVRVSILFLFTFLFSVVGYALVNIKGPPFLTGYAVTGVLIIYVEDRTVTFVNARYPQYEKTTNDYLIRAMRVAGEIIYEMRFALDMVSVMQILNGISYYLDTVAYYQVVGVVLGGLMGIILSRAFFLNRFVIAKNQIYAFDLNIFYLLLLVQVLTIASSVYVTFTI